MYTGNLTRFACTWLMVPLVRNLGSGGGPSSGWAFGSPSARPGVNPNALPQGELDAVWAHLGPADKELAEAQKSIHEKVRGGACERGGRRVRRGCSRPSRLRRVGEGGGAREGGVETRRR